MDKSASLPQEILQIVTNKHTEYPFTGKLNDCDLPGSYLCRQCGLALYRSSNKFHSGCGWPSFDNEVSTNVKKLADADGRRTEILCNRCDAHLGHVFYGEQYTHLNTRHCVNSLSLDFVADQQIADSEEAIFAAGCFWGVEYLFQKMSGIVKTECGYLGGNTNNPTYKDVCYSNTGHLEAVRIVFDNSKTDFEALAKHFFEIHNQAQSDGQGPDIGSQYLSAIFYYNEQQKNTALKLIKQLEDMGLKVATQILPVSVFWPAEEYHQDYYNKNDKLPYCHFYQKKF